MKILVPTIKEAWRIAYEQFCREVPDEGYFIELNIQWLAYADRPDFTPPRALNGRKAVELTMGSNTAV